MSFKVVMTDHVVRDLLEILEYIENRDSPAAADFVAGKIEEAVLSLSDSPHRGPWPKELLAAGIQEFREVFFKPYRVIYQVSGKSALVLLIADGRRDMQSLLERRLIGL